jgi:hypothetical protein
VIPPACLNAATCAAHCNTTSGVGCTTDVAQVVQLPEEVGSGKWRAFYLQFDGVGYETYSASSTDMVHFKLDDPTLAPGQPGVVFSPREGRPPMNDVKPAQGEWDYGSQTFIGPLLADYNVSATRVLRRATPDHSYWYAYGAYPQRNVYEPAPGADGFASSQDGLNWVRRTPHATVDTLADHGAQAWESGQVYAPFIIPAPDGTLADFYNAGGAGGREQSGAAYLPGGADALPGYDFAINASVWVRDPANPTLPNDKVASFQASDPKVFFDDAQGVWVMIYFCNGGTPGGGASICVAFSSDQRSWAKAAEPIYGNGGHPAGLDKCHVSGREAQRRACFFQGPAGLTNSAPLSPPQPITHPLLARRRTSRGSRATARLTGSTCTTPASPATAATRAESCSSPRRRCEPRAPRARGRRSRSAIDVREKEEPGRRPRAALVRPARPSAALGGGGGLETRGELAVGGGLDARDELEVFARQLLGQARPERLEEGAAAPRLGEARGRVDARELGHGVGSARGEAREVERALRGHVADRRLLCDGRGGGRLRAALENPVDDAQVLAEAGPEEGALLAALGGRAAPEEVDVKNLRCRRGGRCQ